MKIKYLLESYLKYLKVKTTKGNYEFNNSHLRLVEKWLNENNIYDHEDLTLDVINSFLIYLKEERKNKNNSINKNLGCLKRALDFNDIYIKGLDKVKITNIQIKRFNILSESELQKTLKYYYNLDRTDLHLFTKYLIFMLLLYTGARRNELINIKISDIDFENNAIILSKTKNGYPRIVFFKDFIKENLLKYIALKDREFLFYNFRYNHRFTPENLSAMFRYDKNILNLKNYSAHMLRHTFATLMVENGCSIPALQLLLGHSSSKTTDIYLHMSVKRVKKDFEDHFPKKI